MYVGLEVPVPEPGGMLEGHERVLGKIRGATLVGNGEGAGVVEIRMYCDLVSIASRPLLPVAADTLGGVDPIERFEALVRRPPASIPLDETMFVIAAHARPSLDIEGQLARLDELAHRCRPPTLDGLLDLLFVEEGFAGNTADYYDPANSLLDHVLDTRSGIPISLAVVVLEVGRRAGVPLRGVGMPGHFLLRDQVDRTLFIDPFDRGGRLDRAACIERFELMQPQTPFDDRFLDPVDNLEILTRVLNNLKGTYRQRNDRSSLVWVLRLRVAIGTVPQSERAELGMVLGGLGRYDEAAVALDEAATAHPSSGEKYSMQAERFRARLN